MNTAVTSPRQSEENKTGAEIAGKEGKAGKVKGEKKVKLGKDGKPKPPKTKKQKIIMLIVLLAVGYGAYTFLAPKPAPVAGEPVPGLVVKLDPLTLNLDGGHYLKLSMALQFTEAASAGGGGHGGGAAEPDGSQALDLAIAQLSGRKIAELNTAESRELAKEKLLQAVAEAYHHDVMDIYFTEFVMQ
ncbi:MAG: flagellar basal body-associated FliL family protein [Sporichthyaceae bacterium]